MSISDLNELLDSELPDDDWETVAGFLFGTLEHVPGRGRERRSGRLALHRRRGRGPPDPSSAGAASKVDQRRFADGADTR